MGGLGCDSGQMSPGRPRAVTGSFKANFLFSSPASPGQRSLVGTLPWEKLAHIGWGRQGQDPAAMRPSWMLCEDVLGGLRGTGHQGGSWRRGRSESSKGKGFLRQSVGGKSAEPHRGRVWGGGAKGLGFQGLGGWVSQGVQC